MASKATPKTNIAPVNARIEGVKTINAAAPAAMDIRIPGTKANRAPSIVVSAENFIIDQTTPVVASINDDMFPISFTDSSVPTIYSKPAPNAIIAVLNAKIEGVKTINAKAPAAMAVRITGAKANRAPSIVVSAENFIIDQTTPVVASINDDIFPINFTDSSVPTIYSKAAPNAIIAAPSARTPGISSTSAAAPTSICGAIVGPKDASNPNAVIDAPIFNISQANIATPFIRAIAAPVIFSNSSVPMV